MWRDGLFPFHSFLSASKEVNMKMHIFFRFIFPSFPVSVQSVDTHRLQEILLRV